MVLTYPLVGEHGDETPHVHRGARQHGGVAAGGERAARRARAAHWRPHEPVGERYNSRQRLRVFLNQLQQLGWLEAHNLRIHYRWTTGGDDEFSRYASELVALAPE